MPRTPHSPAVTALRQALVEIHACPDCLYGLDLEGECMACGYGFRHGRPGESDRDRRRKRKKGKGAGRGKGK